MVVFARCSLAASVSVIAVTLAAAGPALGQTLPVDYTATSLVTGINRPTCMAQAPDGSIYFCQQGGVLRVWQAGVTTNVATFTVDSAGERGLIGLAVDPGFSTNRFLWVYYTTPTPAAHNTVRRITLNAAGTAMVAGSEVSLLELNNLSGATNHNGGGMHFGPDGKIYLGVGENANGANAQNIGNLLGKILRLTPDPANPIPSDNPTSFPGIVGTTSGNNRAIWAVGLRNPFTHAFKPGTGRMHINDVGENTWEEIDLGQAGRNYGWSLTEGFFNQASFPNYSEPLVAYHHSNGELNMPAGIGTFTGNVIAGGTFYNPTNPNFPISFQGDYFFGDAGAGFIRTYDYVANTGAGFATGVGGIVDFVVAADGTLVYLAGSGGTNGRLVRVTYIGTSGVCCAAAGTCTLSNGIGCAGTFMWGTTACSPNPCAQPNGACCAADGTCSSATAAGCGGTFQGAGTVCSPNPCPQPTGACCAADGTCSTSTSAACGGTYQGNGTVCLPNPCPQPTGACCAADGTCATTTSGACGGTYQGNGSACSPNPCPQPTGACCAGSTCSVTTAAACAGVNQHFAGASTVCNAAGNNTTPCCRADFNQSGAVSVQDLFDFLAGYFGNDSAADINGSGVLSVQDLFDFLAAYFAGCS